MFEQALIFGMTPQDFWQGNPQDFYVYANAYIKERTNESTRTTHTRLD